MEKSKVAVVFIPFPAQSHLNQLLHLAAVIASHALPVHYVGTATHNRQAKLRSGLNPTAAAAKIHFHDLHTESIATPEPNYSDKLPVHLLPAVMAYMGIRDQIGSLVKQMSAETTKIVLIYDRLVSEAAGAAVAIPNVESYAFSCLSALNLFAVLWEHLERPFDLEEELKRLPSARELYPEGTIKFVGSMPDHYDEREGDIYNTSRLIEAKYMDLLSRKEVGGGKKQWAIMPTLLHRFPRDDLRRHECLDWLDKQAPRSVMYVSFGTIVSLTNQEMEELAVGLEESGKKFIWVVREADKADIFAGEGRRIELPDGFEERVRGNGIVVRDWAPQLEILAHESTGGFMTHCGWNSCFESLIHGVPVAAWPMHSDQHLNAIFMTEILRVGLSVRARDESAIKSVIQRLLSAEEGEEIRKRAEELSAAVKKSMEEGGVLRREVESFIAHVTR